MSRGYPNLWAMPDAASEGEGPIIAVSPHGTGVALGRITNGATEGMNHRVEWHAYCKISRREYETHAVAGILHR